MTEIVLPVAIVTAEESANVGTKETLELIKLLQVTADVYKAAKADGTINYADLTKLGPMIVALRDGLGGVAGIAAELKDLDAAEASEVTEKLVAALVAMVAAVVS